MIVNSLGFARAVLDGKLPAITVGIVEPQAEMRRARCFGSDLVPWIFDIHAGLPHRFQRSAQMADMPPDGYRQMLCVEAAAVDPPVTLAAGAAWTGIQAITAEPPPRAT